MKTAKTPFDPIELPEGATAALCFDVAKQVGASPRAIGEPLAAGYGISMFAGRAFTVEGTGDFSLSADESLTLWTRMLSRTPANSVLVIAPGDTRRAYMGELSAHALSLKGCQGAIVDGPCRDLAQIEAQRFPVICKGSVPSDVVGAWRPTRFEQPVMVAGELIANAEVIVGDRDGAVVFGFDHLEKVKVGIRDAFESENKVRDAILAGEDPHEAYLKYRKF